MTTLPAPSAALPIVLMPGMMLDHALWQRMLPQLSTLGPLLYGDLSQDESIDAMALRTLAQAPARFTLVGFSMGGFVARAILRLAPERVDRLIMIATSARPDSAATLAFKQKTAESLRLNPGGFRGLSHTAIAISLSPDNEQDPALQQIIRDMSLRLGGECYRRQLLLTRPDDRVALTGYRCPTLVIAARNDRMRSLQESQELADGIAGAQLAVVEQSGHMIPLEQPESLLAVMSSWLQASGRQD